MKTRIPQSGGVNWHGPMGTGVVLPPKSARHVFQYWFKTNPGGGPNGNGIKWFVWWAADTPIPADDHRMQLGPFGNGYAVPGGHMAFTLNDLLGRIGMPMDGYAAQPIGPYFDQVNDGHWHRLTIGWWSPTGAATRDGYVRAWLDGTKIIDLEQATVGVTPPGGTKPWCIQGEVDMIASFQARGI